MQHLLADGVAALGNLAACHLRPVATDDGLGIGARLLSELRALRFWKTRGKSIDVSKSIGFKIGVELSGAVSGPDRVKHEAQDHGIRGADDGELPADEVIVDAAFFNRPEPVEKCHVEKRGGKRGDKNDNILAGRQHRESVLWEVAFVGQGISDRVRGWRTEV